MSVQVRGIRSRSSKGIQIITPTTSTKFDVPAGTKHIMFIVRTNPVHMCDHTTTALTSHPQLPAGTFFTIDNDPEWIKRLRFIDTSAGASSVEAWFYGD